MATRATFRLPRTVNHHQWLADNFPGVQFKEKSRRSDGLVIVVFPGTPTQAQIDAARQKITDEWLGFTVEPVP